VAVEAEIPGGHLGVGAGLAKRLAGVFAFGQRQKVLLTFDQVGETR
jgi:hypothetical protein